MRLELRHLRLFQNRGIQLSAHYLIDQKTRSGEYAIGSERTIPGDGQIEPGIIGNLHTPEGLIVVTDIIPHSRDGRPATESALGRLFQDMSPRVRGHLLRLLRLTIMRNTDYHLPGHLTRPSVQSMGEITTGFQIAIEVTLGDQEKRMMTEDSEVVLTTMTDTIAQVIGNGLEGMTIEEVTVDEIVVVAVMLSADATWILTVPFLPALHSPGPALLLQNHRAHLLMKQYHLHR